MLLYTEKLSIGLHGLRQNWSIRSTTELVYTVYDRIGLCGLRQNWSMRSTAELVYAVHGRIGLCGPRQNWSIRSTAELVVQKMHSCLKVKASLIRTYDTYQHFTYEINCEGSEGIFLHEVETFYKNFCYTYFMILDLPYSRSVRPKTYANELIVAN